MDRTFFRDLLRCLVIISIFYSCGQSVWFISKLSDNQSQANRRYYENQYRYERSYEEQYVEEEVEDTIITSDDW